MRIDCSCAILLTSIFLLPCQSIAASTKDEGGRCIDLPGVVRTDVQCYRYAAEQGDPLSQHHLGFIYADGRGVPQSLQEAYAWWAAAAMNGIEAARFRMNETRGKMTASEAEAAQLRGMEYFLRTGN